MVTEYSRFVNELAPEKKVILRKDENIYENEEVKEYKRDAENLLTEAIQNNTPENWRLFKYCRNKYYRLSNKAKTAYYQRILGKDYSLWRTIKMKERGEPPSEILWHGRRITSPKKISNIMNEFYKKKIIKIQKEMKDPKMDPIQRWTRSKYCRR